MLHIPLFVRQDCAPKKMLADRAIGRYSPTNSKQAIILQSGSSLLQIRRIEPAIAHLIGDRPAPCPAEHPRGAPPVMTKIDQRADAVRAGGRLSHSRAATEETDKPWIG